MIYFIQAGEDGPVKIGFAKTVVGVHRRLAGFQTSHHETLRLLGYLEGSREDEATLHRVFADARVRGEWFSPVPDLLDAAASKDVARWLLNRWQSLERYREWGITGLDGHLTDFGWRYLGALERRVAEDGWNLDRFVEVHGGTVLPVT